ncbi:MAG: HTTM domain-containing protein [Myxococcales bacterium]|nr:HTTM domain-containing protein [Myxococcales bacterium]
MKWFGRLDAWWFEKAPASRLAVIRIAVGLFCLAYLLIRAKNLNGYAYFPEEQFQPVGIIRLHSGPVAFWVVHLVYALTLLLVAPVILGWRYRWTAPVFALLWLWLTSYRNSWTMIFHTENLVTLHVLILGVAAAADAVSYDARTKRPPIDSSRYGWPLRLMSVVTVLVYVIAGIAKVRNAGWAWLSGDQLRIHIAYDNLRKIELGDVYSPLGAWLVRWPWIFTPLACLSLGLELGAPLALVKRRWGLVWAGFVMAFHAGILALMAILFAYPLSGVAFLSWTRAERALTWDWVNRWLPRRDRDLPTEAPR